MKTSNKYKKYKYKNMLNLSNLPQCHHPVDEGEGENGRDSNYELI